MYISKMMHMNKIFSFFSNWMLSSRTPLFINDFKEMRYIPPAYPDNWVDWAVKNKPGGVLLEYYDKDIRIGYIRYYITTGQIGLFYIDNEYQHHGLGKQILSKVIEELKTNNTDSHITISYAVFCLKKKKTRKLQRKINTIKRIINI